MGNLLVWQDTNEDGQTDEGELHTLGDFNIASIDLAGVVELTTPETNEGSIITHTGTFVTDDGGGPVSNIVHDVWFQVYQVQSRYVEPVTLDELTLYLPTLRGFGSLKDLHLAMSEDNSGTGNLRDQVVDLVLTGFGDLFITDTDSAIEAILYRWAGVESVASDARGDYLVDAKHLEFLEEAFGAEFLQRGWRTDPLPQAADAIEELWNDTFQHFKAALLFQAGGDALFAGSDATYNLTTGTVESTTFDLNQNAIQDLEDAALALSSGEREAFWSDVASFIANTKGEVTDGTELGWLDDAVYNSSTPGLSDWADAAALIVEADPNVINGDGSNNTLNGTSGADAISGAGGDDTIDGSGGKDKLYGGDGADTIHGGSGNDYIEGNNDGDFIYGEAGDDVIKGGAGNDLLDGGDGSDSIEGGSGDDTYIYTGGNRRLFGVLIQQHRGRPSHGHGDCSG